MAYAIEPLGTVLTIGSTTFCVESMGSPGLDGGEPLDATCLANTAWVTKLPQTLKEVTDLNFTVKFEPADWSQIVGEINVNQLCTINFASPLGTLSVWSYLRSFTPNEAGRGETWTASCVLTVTNMNGSNVETAPSYA